MGGCPSFQLPVWPAGWACPGGEVERPPWARKGLTAALCRPNKLKDTQTRAPAERGPQGGEGPMGWAGLGAERGAIDPDLAVPCYFGED